VKSASSDSRFTLSPRGRVALLAILAVVAYLPALRAGFIWDDRLLLTESDLIKSPNGWLRLWFGAESPDYFPVTYTTFWLEYRLWALNPLGYHLVNVLLHAASSIVLWRVLLRLGVPAAWFAAVLFAVHPVNAATVAWVAERKNTLSMLFYLSAAIFYFRAEAGRRRSDYAVSLGFFLLALLSKTSVVMLPPVLLLCAWWQRGCISRTDLRRTIPFFALSLAAGLVTVWFQNHNVINEFEIDLGDFSTRLVRAGCAVSFYAGQLVFPWNLSLLYPRWDVHASSLHWILPALLPLAVMLAAAFFRRSWGRPVLFAMGYFLLSLLPVLGFLRMYYFRLSPVADQWLYIPGIGILALAAAAGMAATRRWPLARSCIAGAIVAALAVQTWQRAVVMQSSGTLWADVLRRDPSSWTAELNLAIHDLSQGGRESALAHARRAAELEPGFVESYLNLGAIFDVNGLGAESIAAYRKAIDLKPGYAQAHNELAIALEGQGRTDEAVREYREAVRLRPANDQFQLNLGALLFKHGRYDEAIPAFREVVRLRPDSVDGHNDLGASLHSLGRLEEAAAEYREALRLNPLHADARRNLEAILATDPSARQLK